MSPEASPGGCHAAAARDGSAPKEGDGSPGDGHDPAPECEWLEAAHRGCSRDPTRVRGRGEGRAAFASAHWELAAAPWAESDGPCAACGCERDSRGPLGGRGLNAHRPEPRQTGGFTEGREAGGEGVARSQGQGDGIAEASDSQAPDEETQKIEAVGGGTWRSAVDKRSTDSEDEGMMRIIASFFDFIGNNKIVSSVARAAMVGAGEWPIDPMLNSEPKGAFFPVGQPKSQRGVT